MNISSKIRELYKDFIKTESTPIKTLETQLYNSLEIGDLLEAEVIDNIQNQIKILLADGEVFQASLEKPLDVFIGQEVVLEVKDIIDNQVILSMYQNKTDIEEVENFEIKNVLKQINVETTETSKQAVKLLMDKTLPITKDAIENITHSIESLDIPLETIIKLLDRNIPVSKENLNQMQQYEDGQIKLEKQLIKILDQVMEINTPEDLATIYIKLKEISSREIPHQEPSLQNPTSENPSLDSMDKNLHLELNQEIIQVINKFNNLEAKDVGALKKAIAKTFKEQFFIKTTDLHKEAKTQLNKIKKIYKDTYELVDIIEKLEVKSSNQEKLEVYNDTKSNIEFLNIANRYDTMIQIPLMLQDQNKQGELYIFNRSKKGKKDYKQSSMLISLETVNIGTVESYIRKDNNQIRCQFKLDNDKIQKLIKSNIGRLENSLKSKGYNLVSVKYLSATEIFENKEEKKEIKETNTLKRYRFDTKV